MNTDARFEDGAEAPLNLGALDGEDLQVISSLIQDAVFPVTEMRWIPTERRFALLLNRLRWEDVEAAKQRGRAVERVQSVLVINDVMNVASQGVDRSDKDVVLSLLSLEFVEGDDAAGELMLTLAGDGALRLSVEALDVSLKDVTKPYAAPSRHVPDHGV